MGIIWIWMKFVKRTSIEAPTIKNIILIHGICVLPERSKGCWDVDLCGYEGKESVADAQLFEDRS